MNNTCPCNWCLRWVPLLRRIECQLNDRARADLGLFITHIIDSHPDIGAMHEKLNGHWPTWTPASTKTTTPQPKGKNP